jgi:membrane-bound ClpP family serine protease
MAKSNSEMENWHKHRGKGAVLFGILILLVGLMKYYQFSWPMILMIVGVLFILFGLFRMMKK